MTLRPKSLVAAVLLLSVAACAPAPKPPPPPPARPSAKAVATSDCASCHNAEAAAWKGSQHALAQRPPDGRPLPPGIPGEQAGWLGVAPLEQALVSAENGRIQVADPARDTTTGAWFSVHGDHPPRPSDWGGWASRSNTWNSQCAQCHTTGFEKRYDATRDRFDSRYAARGVTCAACHAVGADHGTQRDHAAARPAQGARTEACIACHGVGEHLPAEKAGERDTFRLADPNGIDQFADGRAREELFEAATFASSRLHDAGVDCLDCHDPHSGSLRAPLEANALCLQCHAAGLPPAGRKLNAAPPVITAAHSHHSPESAGAACVACHMPERTFMARDSRRDHRFASPDPAADAAEGSPDVCTGCHTDRDATWAAATAEKWWPGIAAKRSSSARTALLAAAAGAPMAAEAVALRFGREPNARERVRLLAAIAPPAQGGLTTLRAALEDPDETVRAAAIRFLGRLPAERASLLRYRDAAGRDERLSALWATRRDPMSPAQNSEVEAWLGQTLDDPAGALRAAEWYLLRGNGPRALLHARAAAAWAPSPATLTTLAAVLQQQGQAAEAAAIMARVAALQGP